MGGVHVQPTNVQSGLTKIFDVESSGGVLYVAGEKDGKAAYQSFDLSTGVPVAGSVQVLPSLDSNNEQGSVIDVQIVNGAVTFIGESHVSGQSNQGFVWDLAGNPTVVPSPNGGLLEAGNPDGIVVGFGQSDHAAVGTIGGSLQLLPEIYGGGATSISADGKWIVGGDGFGPAAWFSNDPLSLDYTLASINLEANLNGDTPFDLGVTRRPLCCN